ncbi:hypothetical protein ACTA71_004445 [Dictyostelium dimigraforme]
MNNNTNNNENDIISNNNHNHNNSNNNNNNNNTIENEDLYIITDDINNNQYIRNNINNSNNKENNYNNSNSNIINGNNRINKAGSSNSINSNEISDITPIIKSINNDNEDEELPLSILQKESNTKKVRRHVIGSILVLSVVSLWVASSIITQIIFTTESYDKPFFLTYFGTSIFSFYLGGYFIKWKKWTSIPFNTNQDDDDDIENNSNKSESPTTPIITKDKNIENGLPEINSTSTTTTTTTTVTNYKFTLKQILRTSLLLAPFWFFANYTYNLSLDKTSVSTNTILSTLSGIFSLILSVIFKVDKFTIEKLFATLLTLTGVILVSYSDFDKSSNGSDTVIGDILAIVGAFLYGLYSVLVKKLIGSEENLPMPMMFGYLGLFNLIFLWPAFFILNLTSWEVFELPSSRVLVYLIFNGIFGSFISDLLDSYSVVMTSPVINSIGLSLSIPFAMISDFVRTGKKFTLMYLFGSCFVVLGFLLINLASSIFEKKLKYIEGKLFSRVKNLLNIKKND